MIVHAMSDNPLRSTRNRRSQQAPGWIAPALAGILALAVTWGTGVTVFRSSLENHGLPRELQGASADEQTAYRYGAQLADLGARAQALAALAGKDQGQPLQQLAGSLKSSAALFGELRYSSDNALHLPSSYSAQEVEKLAADVAGLASSLPEFEQVDYQRNELLAGIAFQTSFDARQALAAAAGAKQAGKLPAPLSAMAQDGSSQAKVSCLTDDSRLEGTVDAADKVDAGSVALARALERGYSLDYLLQLQAARGARTEAGAVEQSRAQLAGQLAALREALEGQCPDSRQLAYALPEDGLAHLPQLAAQASSDFSRALVSAAGNLEGESQQAAAEAAFERIAAQQDSSQALDLVRTAARN